MAMGWPGRACARWSLFGAGLALAALAHPARAQQQQAAAPIARSFPASPSAADAQPRSDKLRTRFVIGLERDVEFQVFSLTNPNRVFIELPDVKLQLPQHPGETPVGLVKSFRGGLSAPGKARVVIDVTGPVVVDKATIEKDGKTARLMVEIVQADPGLDAQAANARRAEMLPGAYGLGAGSLQPPMPRPAVSPQARAQGMYKPVIVLDPGHGGDDTGATKGGTVEKNVVLAFSLKLRDKLMASGRYKVLMTRDKDVFVELHERRDFAERNAAALFVAVHADYAQSKARGATIYSLREGVATELQRSAKGEVSEHVLSGAEMKLARGSDADIGSVRQILADLARREVDMTRDRTNVFVRSVIEYMGGTTNLKDNPDRSAAFVVLKTAKVPSILIELGYVTNEEDAELLKSEAWREKVSGSIVTAIDNYFSHQLARLPM
jgi:N-acetylmuramoyl-L-alanine amidase